MQEAVLEMLCKILLVFFYGDTLLLLLACAFDLDPE